MPILITRKIVYLYFSGCFCSKLSREFSTRGDLFFRCRPLLHFPRKNILQEKIMLFQLERTHKSSPAPETGSSPTVETGSLIAMEASCFSSVETSCCSACVYNENHDFPFFCKKAKISKLLFSRKVTTYFREIMCQHFIFRKFRETSTKIL